MLGPCQRAKQTVENKDDGDTSARLCVLNDTKGP